MSRDRMNRVRELFEKALDLSEYDRKVFLEDACGDDRVLRREIDSLLAADEASEGFMEQPLVEHGFDLSSAGSEREGSRRRIGHYEILRRIGEGGMSEVYLAVRADDEYQTNTRRASRSRSSATISIARTCFGASGPKGRSWRGSTIPTSPSCSTAAPPKKGCRTS